MTAPLADLIAAGYAVTRWHTMVNSRPQNLASHLWGVAMILSRTYNGPINLFPILIRAALEHDLAESSIGDMPRPARTAEHRAMEASVATGMGIVHEEMLPNDLRVWLEWADLIEAGLHAKREVEVGNTNFKEVLSRIDKILISKCEEIPAPLFHFAQDAGLI